MAESVAGAGPLGGARVGSVPKGSDPVWRLVAALYVAEALAVAILLSAYRLEGKAGVGDFLTSRPGMVCLGAGVGLLVTLSFIIRQCRAGVKSGSKQWLFGLAMNGAAMAGLLSTGEFTLRMMSVESNTEERIAGKLLYPRQWNITASKFRTILKLAETHPTFWVSDHDLGWTVGPNRKSSDGLYFSSAEGIRSSGAGQSYKELTHSCRIAFVGDSYTFGEEVTYENAWVSMLSQEFGAQCQALNFGVGGYGIDQMYLRYMRDVRPWNPDVVVMAFVNHDVVRSLSVYSFLLFPGGETPFAKPRFIVQESQLTPLNSPLITPEETFTKRSIAELPYIEHDVNYRETEWDRPAWSFFNRSYLFRLMTSVYPLHERARPEVSDQVLQDVNTAVFRSFRSAVAASGAKPLIVYLPSVEELPDRLPWEPVGLKVLREGQIPHLDLRDCMGRGYSSEMFMPVGRGQHYAPAGNREAARCLSEPIRALLPRRSL